VAGKAGGIPEVIEDGKTGILCPPGDAGAVADAIARLLQDRDAARTMGKRARKRIESHFSVDAMVEGNLDVYRNVVRARQQGRHANP
jgi:glycosyltransferase involved in cell wall biosynthesis